MGEIVMGIKKELIEKGRKIEKTNEQRGISDRKSKEGGER